MHVPAWDPGWDTLSLDFRVDWPLGLLVTPGLLAKYNALFQFLLRLRQCFVTALPYC